MCREDNLEFDARSWRSKFSADELRRCLDGWTQPLIASPSQLLAIEMAREHALQTVVRPEVVGTDIFVFANGCPPRRDITKVGGVPYRPRDVDWPEDATGNPLTFIGQLCFAESKDLFDQLPGDILLLFADREWVSHLHAEWYPLGLTALMSPHEVPKTSWSVPELWGVRYRSVDYRDYTCSLPRTCCPFLLGTKIGGLSSFHFDNDGTYLAETRLTRALWNDGVVEVPTGHFLGMLASVQPQPAIAYPWLNSPEPVPVDELTDAPQFILGDMNWIELFLEPDGRVLWWGSRDP
jgi:hypothetical protein